MRVTHSGLLLLSYFLLAFNPLADAETTAEQRGQIQAARSEVEALKTQKTPDTVFQFNTGLSQPQGVAEKVSQYLSPKAKELADIDVDGFNDAQLENAEKKLNQQYQDKGKTRRENAQKINQKHKRYEQLEIEIDKNGTKAQQRLEAALEKKKLNKGKTSKAVEAEIKEQTRRVNKAKVKKQYVRTKKANLGKSRNTAKYLKLRREIAATKSKITKMKKALRRGAKFDDGSAILGIVLTAISSELEENAQASREGRKPLAANKLINFAKNISGYSTVKGVLENVELAKMEALVDTLEFYEKNDFDLSDPEVQKMVMQRAEDSARRAVARTAIYEGAKIAPLTGDLITIKESFDSAGQAYVAAEEAEYMLATNEQDQFQTSLRARVKANAVVSELEYTAQQTKLLIASLSKMSNKLQQLNKHAEANRQQLSASIQTLEAYNQQAEALKSLNPGAMLEPAAVEGLLKQLNAIKASADEQAGNINRVKSEHNAGELTVQAVATQAKFIGDLLQPAISDYQALAQTLSSIEALSKGAELTAKVPEALALVKQAKAVMAQDAKMAAGLYETYRSQADTLEQLYQQHQAARAKLPKLLEYASSSKNLEENHRNRITATLDRANGITINQTALKRAVAEVRGLRNTAEMVAALASLDKPPQVVDAAQVNAISQQAQQAWGNLSGPNQAAADSLQMAQQLLHELVALAGEAEPLEIKAEEPQEKPDNKLQGKLFAGKNWLDLTPDDIEQIILNENKEDEYIHKDYFGFKSYDFPENIKPGDYCDEIKDQYCPKDGKLYRNLEQGTTEVKWGDKKYQAPYWIAFKLREFYVDLNLNPPKIEPLKDYFRLTSDIKNAEFHKESPTTTSITLPHADEAIVFTKTHSSGISETNLFARKGPLVIQINGDLECWTGKHEGRDEKQQFWEHYVRTRKEWITNRLSDSFVERCVDWSHQKDVILAEFVDQLLDETDGVLNKLDQRFYYKPMHFSLALDGFKQTFADESLDFSDAAVFRFFRSEEVKTGKNSTTSINESYDVQINMESVHYSESYNDVMRERDQKIDKELTTQMFEDQEFKDIKVKLEGVDYVRMKQKNKTYVSTRITKYSTRGRLVGRIANVYFSIRYNTNSLKGHSTRVLQIAKNIASQIQKAQKGW